MNTFRSNRWFVFSLILALAVAVFAPAARSQDDSPEELTIPLDGVEVIRTNTSISRVITGKSSVVKIQVLNSREIAVFGLQTGVTTLHIWTDRGLRQNILAVEEVGTLSTGTNFRSVITAQDDMKGETGDMEMRVFSPEYRKVSEFKNYISQLLKDDGKVLLSDQPSGKIFVVGKTSILDKIEGLIDRLDVPGKEKIYSQRFVLQHRPVTQIMDQVGTILSDKGKVVMDRETNSLLVVDTVEKVNSIESYLSEIDQPTVRQVRIKARFVEMSDEAERRLGVKWSSQGSVKGDPVPMQSGSGGAGFSPAFSGFQAVYDNLSGGIDAQLRALETQNQLNLISAPNVVTRNQQEAKLTINNTVNYVSGCEISQIQGAQTVQPVISEVSDGITLTVTPMIGNNDVIQLDVVPELKIIGDFDQRTTSGASGTSCTFETVDVDTRRANLNVALEDGQTLVIGGLSRHSKNTSNTDVPLLSDIPLLGFLFSQDTKSSTDRDITIFLTAEIVDILDDSSTKTSSSTRTGGPVKVKKEVSKPMFKSDEPSALPAANQ